MLSADESTGAAAVRDRTLVPLPLDGVDFPEPSRTGPGGPLFGRTLRLALALKGGVSLAVWIGGAVAEVDVLRRIRIGRGGAFYALPVGAAGPPARAVAYARLLCSRAYDRVEVDVLAGASAGGLNSVLYAAAQRADSDPGRLLDLWLETADLSALLRRPGFGRVYSLLDGDGYIWPRILEVLHTLYAPLTPGPGDRPGGAHRVVVDLSATVLDPSPGRGPVGADGSAGFRFVGGGTPEEEHGRRIPSSREGWQPAGIADDLARLAYAARATSSFPGAFEPALVWSHPTPPPPGTPPVPPNDHTDLTFAFSAHRAPPAAGRPAPFRVVDGGVLDNVPIDRALRTITDLPSPEHTDRVLVYFDPNPFEPDTVSPLPLATTPPPTPVMTDAGQARAPRPARRNDRLSAFVGTIAVAVGMRGVREHAEHEIDDVERARIAADRARGRRVALSAWSEAAQEPGFLGTARQRYALMRASTDADLLANVLSQPEEWQLHSQLTGRRRLRPAPRAVRDALGEELRAQAARAPVQAYLTGPQGILEHALAGLGWIRALEEHAFATTGCARLPDSGRGDPEVQTRIRLNLYAVASRTRAERDRRLLPLVAEFVAEEPVPLPDAAAVAARWIDMQGPTDPALPAQLEQAVVLLRSLAPVGPLPPGSPWTVSPWAHFPAGATAVDLAPFIAPSGVPATSGSLRFATVTASDPKPPHPGPDVPTAGGAVLPSPLDAVRRELTLEGQARAASRWITLGRRELGDDRLRLPRSADAAVKLAGSRLANFGAFLSADWRANDWWWGRVDASRGLARVLSGLPAAPSCTAATSPTWTTADRITIEDDIVADREAADGSADPWAWRRGMQPLTGLPEPLRFGLVSDGVRVALRAMLPHLGFVPTSLLVLLVPLLAVFVPYLASARRAITAGVFVGLAFLVMFEVHLCRPGTAGCAATWGASVSTAPTRLALEVLVVGAVAAIGVWVGGVCLRRFRNAGLVLVAVQDRLCGAQPGLAARIRAARHTLVVFALGCLLAPLPAIMLWVVDTGLAPRAWFALIAAVGTAGTLAVTSAHVPAAAAAGTRIRRAVAAALLPGAFAWLVPGLVLALSPPLTATVPLPGSVSPERAVTSAVWVLTCVAVAVTLTSWWLTWWHAALVTTVAGGLAFVATLLVTLAAWPLPLSVIIGWAALTHAIWWLASFDRPRWMHRVPAHRQRVGQAQRIRSWRTPAASTRAPR